MYRCISRIHNILVLILIKCVLLLAQYLLLPINLCSIFIVVFKSINNCCTISDTSSIWIQDCDCIFGFGDSIVFRTFNLTLSTWWSMAFAEEYVNRLFRNSENSSLTDFASGHKKIKCLLFCFRNITCDIRNIAIIFWRFLGLYPHLLSSVKGVNTKIQRIL